MDRFWDVASGPRLYRINRQGSVAGRKYEPGSAESICDSAIKLIQLTYSLGLYISPILFSYFYSRANTLFRITGALVMAFGGSYVLRGISRARNPTYVSFLTAHTQSKQLTIDELKARKAELLSQYDFEFTAWPVEYRWHESPMADAKKPPQPLGQRGQDQTFLAKLTRLPLDVLAYVAVHSFGRRMMYPGSVAILQRALHPMLLEGRSRLVEKYHGERFKLESYDLNHIDAMFIDRRRTSSSNGSTLVICCEGNAGFYEIGVMGTPIEAGYSVLGWNHPGFGGSTGLPFPESEVAAIDTVVKFAVDKLGFRFKDIILYAWSIGGYTCSWAAAHYPEVRGLVLDATFDDVIPLATAKMPPSWRPLVVHTVRSYFNLNNSENLKQYYGPVVLIRRLQDEIIHTNESDPVRTNRANDFLVSLLENRFPNLINHAEPRWALQDWMCGDLQHRLQVQQQHNVNDELCLATLASYIESNGSHYPVNIGEDLQDDVRTQLLLYLASKHLYDYDSTHCTPLPKELFIEPFDLFDAITPRSSKSSL